MPVNEADAEFRARQLVRETSPKSIPVSVEAYVQTVGAVLRIDPELGEDEPGWSFENKGKYYICVNANDSIERQRFTICHELAHIVLGLPSEHQEVPSWSHVKRTPNEISCDVFAAELLMPATLFQPLVAIESIGMESIDALAKKALASFSATGSRFANVAKAPCAFVFSEGGTVRYASRSTALRQANGWIPPRHILPEGSVAKRVRGGESCVEAEEVESDVWFADWQRGGILLEQARHFQRWDQTFALLWFEDDELPPPKPGSREEGDLGLKELDGILPWPGKKHRK